MPSPSPALSTLKHQLHDTYAFPTALLGIMGDARHQATKSDHNDGNALDIPSSLGRTRTRALALLLLKDPRVHYVIFDRTFYHAGRKAARYTGTDPHTGHIHLSIYPASREDARPWLVASKPVAKPVIAEVVRVGTVYGKQPMWQYSTLGGKVKGTAREEVRILAEGPTWYYVRRGMGILAREGYVSKTYIKETT